LWRFAGELFETDETELALSKSGAAIQSYTFRSEWMHGVGDLLRRATLEVPQEPSMRTGGRHGRHSEHLGHMLAEMQIVARSFPEAKW
jgi:ring-1,2-phenylacetyl-CoA epoxidase subunit PaaC